MIPSENLMDLPPCKRPWYLSHPHLETIYPSILRRVEKPGYRRERITTNDDDFLDLDWLRHGCKRLAIISHGLEGDSNRAYVSGMATKLATNGWDVLAWNFRGCGGEINQQPRFTHNGATEDLEVVVLHALKKYSYKTIALVGFSMGGNLSLMYLGREFERVPEEIKGAVCFSVPCDLKDASLALAETGNAIYMKRFLRLMGVKVRQQAKKFPEHFPCADYSSLKTFGDFDGRYTAPLHGFCDAEDYWEMCSSKRYLSRVRVPVWVVNARNDSFLPPSCYPDFSLHRNSKVTLIVPEHGGHCGFATTGSARPYWSEYVANRLLFSLHP